MSNKIGSLSIINIVREPIWPKIYVTILATVLIFGIFCPRGIDLTPQTAQNAYFDARSAASIT